MVEAEAGARQEQGGEEPRAPIRARRGGASAAPGARAAARVIGLALDEAELARAQAQGMLEHEGARDRRGGGEEDREGGADAASGRACGPQNR